MQFKGGKLGLCTHYNSGTHEISLQFGIPRRGGAFLSPRFLD